MANIASLFTASQVQYDQIVNKSMTAEELEMLKQFGFENGDGFIDRAEFMVLCLMRLQVVDPVVVSIIQKRFEMLDHSGTGKLQCDVDVRTGWRDSISAAVSSFKSLTNNLRTSNWYVGRSFRNRESEVIAKKYAGRWRFMASLSSAAICPEQEIPGVFDEAGNYLESQKETDEEEQL
jgi:hypothetical protein